MDDRGLVIRGAPRYLTGRAAGAEGVLAIVPEAEIAPAGQTVRPAAIILLPPGAARRYPIADGAQGIEYLMKWRRQHAWPNRQEGVRLDTGSPSSDVAESRIVAGGPAPAEDPRIAAVFGPTQESADGATIALFEAILLPGDDHPRRTPYGELEIAGGVVTTHLRQGGAGNWGLALLAVPLLFVMGALLRRMRKP